MSTFRNTPLHKYMSSPVAQVSPETSLEDVYEVLSVAKVSCLAVVDKGGLVGVISRSDLLREGRRAAVQPEATNPRHLLLQFADKSVSEVMTPQPTSLDSECDLQLAAQTMVENRVHRVFVTSDSQLVGVLSTLDLMAAIRDAGSSEQIDEFMSAPILVTDIEDSVADASDKLRESQISGLIAVENDWPVGVFTQVEALSARNLPESTSVNDIMDPALICMPTTTPMHRAAQQGIRMRVRRIVACESRHMRGLLSGLDFAAFVASAPS